MAELAVVKRPIGQRSADIHAADDLSHEGPSPAEGLRLFKAFAGIHDAALRRSVIHLIELLGAAAVKR